MRKWFSDNLVPLSAAYPKSHHSCHRRMDFPGAVTALTARLCSQPLIGEWTSALVLHTSYVVWLRISLWCCSASMLSSFQASDLRKSMFLSYFL